MPPPPKQPPTPLQQMRQDVAKLQDSYWDQQLQAASNRRVALVEGDDDKAALEAMLTAADPVWATRATVVVAGDRKRVLGRMAAGSTFPTAIGLVDRDVWTDTEVAARTSSGRLYVTEGWCIENDLLTARDSNDPRALDVDLEAVREAWVRAGALWWALQRKQEAFGEWRVALGWKYGDLRSDLDLSSAATLESSLAATIPVAARSAADLDLAAIGQAFQTRLDEMGAWPPPRQWMRGVRGKSAFSQALVPILNRHFGQRSARDWLVARAPLARRHPPFDAILANLL